MTMPVSWTITPAPHMHSRMNTQKIMLAVIGALVPAMAASVIFFGPRALVLLLICGGVSVLTEFVCQKLMKKPVTVSDGSALLTGVLLALNLPVTLPFWQAAVGCIFAVAIVKQLFGGLGHNFANPAITARIFLLLSFSSDMTTWVKPFFYRGSTFGEMMASSAAMSDSQLDAVTSATPLVTQDASLSSLFWGHVGGSMGETSALALLLGAAFLLTMRIIPWQTPLAYLGGLAVLETFYMLASGGTWMDIPYALLSGGVLLGAFFMATDYVTTPITGKGRLIFGLGCAVLTFIIREFASMPEGCSFSILLMNLLTPYIERLTMPKPFGAKSKEERQAKGA